MKTPRLSLRKQEILRGYQTFSRVITEGQSIQKGAVRCFFAAARGRRQTLRVGFSVSRSARNAVERNRARRWLREAYRKNKHLVVNPLAPMSESVDVVFMVRVHEQPSRTSAFHDAIDQAMITLLMELHHHLSDKQ